MPSRDRYDEDRRRPGAVGGFLLGLLGLGVVVYFRVVAQGGPVSWEVRDELPNDIVGLVFNSHLHETRRKAEDLKWVIVKVALEKPPTTEKPSPPVLSNKDGLGYTPVHSDFGSSPEGKLVQIRGVFLVPRKLTEGEPLTLRFDGREYSLE